MAVNLSPVGGVAAQFFTNNAVPLSGGKLYTYAAGTTTPQVAYTTSQGNIAWTNPIVLDAGGRVPGSGEVWLTDGLIYKFVLKDANDVLIATYDNITGINSNFVAFTNSQEIQTATAGQTVFTLTTMQYQVGTNSLSVFVDGVNQYGPGAQYAYVETDSTTVTFASGLHVGAEVKFTTTQQQGAGAVDAEQVSYTPPFANSVTTNVEAKLAQYVSVKDFGAVGNGSVDDTAAIQLAFDSGLDIYFPEGNYLITDTVTMGATGQLADQRNNRIITMDGVVVYDGPQDRAALEFGADGEYMSRCVFTIRVRAANAPDWLDENYIGASFINPNTCRITVELTQQFTVGVRYLGWNQGAYYNTIFHGLIYDNKIGALYASKTAAGVCNENYTFGGRYVVDSSVNLNKNRYGVVIGSLDGLYPDNNANSFYGMSTEISAGNLTGGAVAYGIWLQDARENIFRSWRTEAAGTTNSSANVLISNASSGNIIESSYGAVIVNDQSSLPNVDVSGPVYAHKLNVRKGWNSGALGRIATQYDATDIMVPGCDLYATTGTDAYNYVGGWQIDNKDYIETTSGRGIGISVDTVQQKQFLACVDFVSGFGGRVAVRCYDAAGAILGSAVTSYAKGTGGLTLTYASNPQWYATGGDNNAAVMFTVTSDVKSIDVVFTSGTAALKIKSFGIYAVGLVSNDSNLTVFNRAVGVSADKTRYGTMIPVLGWYVPTDTVKRYPPLAGQPLGWTCTAGSFQTTGTINSGSNSLTVASAGSAPFALANGMGITVVGAGAAGANLRTTISNVVGTTITLAANAGTSVVSAQVATSGSWAALANL